MEALSHNKVIYDIILINVIQPQLEGNLIGQLNLNASKPTKFLSIKAEETLKGKGGPLIEKMAFKIQLNLLLELFSQVYFSFFIQFHLSSAFPKRP